VAPRCSGTQLAAFTKASACSLPGCGARVTVSGAPVHDAGDPGHVVPRYLPNAVPRNRINGNIIRCMTGHIYA